MLLDFLFQLSKENGINTTVPFVYMFVYPSVPSNLLVNFNQFLAAAEASGDHILAR